MGCAIYSVCLSGVSWLETTQNDFADGQFDPQLYCSHRNGGTVEFFPRFDVNNDGFFDLVASDAYGPSVHLYFGSNSGYFPTDVNLYPIRSGGGCDLADLNCDGFAELIHSGWGMDTLTIYWGTPNGPSASNFTAFPNEGSETVFIDDLDKDGYLDIITGMAIFWGDSTGYSASSKTTLPGMGGNHNLEVGDLNQDGWPDIITVAVDDSIQTIFYGNPNRIFHSESLVVFNQQGAHGCSIGDLDQDGNLDVVYTGHIPIVTSRIFWGSNNGPTQSKSLTVSPGPCYGGSALVDWDHDGWLDIVFLRGEGGVPRTPFLYINLGRPPYFSDSNRVEIGNYKFEASGGFVADFNFDGALDLYVNDCSLNKSSYILWGPDYTRITALPSASDHHATFREPGSVFNRNYEAAYISSVFDGGTIMNGGTVRWQANEFPYTSVLLSLRSGDSSTPDTSWTAWTQLDNFSPLPRTVVGRRYYQYQATLQYERPSSLPWLEEVEFNFDIRSAAVSVEPNQSDTILPGQSVNYALYAQNDGNSVDTIDLTTRSSESWPVELLDATGTVLLTDHNGNGIPDLAGVDAFGGRLNFIAKITGAQPGTDTTLVIGRSTIDPTKGDSADLITFIAPETTLIFVNLAPDTTRIIERPESLTIFPMRLSVWGKNLANRQIYVDLSIAQNRWPAELFDSLGTTLQDGNKNGILDLGPIPMKNDSGTANILVKVSVPDNSGYITGRVDSLLTDVLVVTGQCSLRVNDYQLLVAEDKAQLTTMLVPPLNVHNYPNPFSGKTTFIFSLPEPGTVSLKLFNRAGERITTLIKDKQHYSRGIHALRWDGRNESGKPVAPGVYIYLFAFKDDGAETDQVKQTRTFTKKVVVLPE